MSKDETYYLHQTPNDLARDLINITPFDSSDILYEPFRGEGAFYNSFPESNPKDWSELLEGRDYKDYDKEYDWVISNPPFRLDGENGRTNSFYYLLDYYIQRAKKGVAFLGNDYCLATLTPNRLEKINNRGWYINKIVVCSVKKWRGRYFYIIFTKTPNPLYTYLKTNY
jgi:hypothetical protein